MEEIGVVSSVSGPIAKVAVEKKGLCEKCSVGICRLTDEGAELEALNEAGAQVGQKVRVMLRPYSYLKGSAIVYGLPSLALIAGAVLGRKAAGALGMEPDAASALLGFGCMGLSLLAVKLWSMRAEGKTEYKPVIVEIIQ